MIVKTHGNTYNLIGRQHSALLLNVFYGAARSFKYFKLYSQQVSTCVFSFVIIES